MSAANLEIVDQISALLNTPGSRPDWMSEVLTTITRFDTLGLSAEGCMFEVEGEKMNLVAQIGPSTACDRLHSGIGLGDCLCGEVARTGQLITSLNCDENCRHKSDAAKEPRGHVVVPLKASGQLVGVLCLYLPPEREVEPSALKTLVLLGEQLGLALLSARLDRQLRELQLEDPTNGLATLRMLKLLGARQIAEAKRYQRPLSLLSLTIDGASTGLGAARPTPSSIEDPDGSPPTIEGIAQQLDALTREVDLVACCGDPPDEAIALLPETGKEAALAAAERIRAALQRGGTCTVNLGVATHQPQMTRLDDLLQAARDARTTAPTDHAREG